MGRNYDWISGYRIYKFDQADTTIAKGESDIL